MDKYNLLISNNDKKMKSHKDYKTLLIYAFKIKKQKKSRSKIYKWKTSVNQIHFLQININYKIILNLIYHLIINYVFFNLKEI